MEAMAEQSSARLANAAQHKGGEEREGEGCGESCAEIEEHA